jgi:cell division protein FtsZ
MTAFAESLMDAPVAQKPVGLTVLGVGGAGSNALAHLSRHDFDGVRFAALNTDAAALRQSPVESKLMLGSKSRRGLGAGSDPELGRAAALEEAEKIRALCEGAGVVFIVAGLGGGTGTGAGPIVARIAREAGALVMAIVVMPFECEGPRRRQRAQAGLEELRRSADAVICLPNQKVFKLIDDNTSLLDAFELTNDFVADAVRAIYRLLSRPGLIQVDFADLCAVAQGKNTETSFATAYARGEGRAREVVEKLLEHPLLENAQALAEANAVLVSIAGGPGLTMAEVNRIMEPINRHCEHAHIILGATIDDQFIDAISVTLIASSPAPPEPMRTLADAQAGDEQAIAAAVSSPPGERPIVVAAAPREFSPDAAREKSPGTSRQRKTTMRMRQGQLPLDVVSKGRFEKSEPTIYHGQDLDVPTYIRRGIPLN